MRNIRKDLHDLAERPFWKRFLFDLSINSMSLLFQGLEFWYDLNVNFPHLTRPFVKRTVQRAHYVGADIQRPHKLAASMLLGVLIGGLVQAPTFSHMMMWALGWGTVFSVIVTFKSIKRWLQIMAWIGPARKKAA